MSKDKASDQSTRRDFLKLASATAPAAAVAAMAGTEAAAAPLESTGETLLQDTAHTRAYFESTRF